MLGKSLLNQLLQDFYQNPREGLWPMSLAMDLAAHGATGPISVVGILN
jgi:hypothetical protein